MSKTRITPKKEWDGKVSHDTGYRFALAYMISELRLMPVEDWTGIDLDECLEARIFGENAELHIFREDDKWMAVEVQDVAVAPEDGEEEISNPDTEKVPGDAFIDRAYALRGNMIQMISGTCGEEVPKYKEIIVREYIDYDEDGQATTVKTRLVGLR